MTDIRKHISTLTMPEKVELFNDLYGELSGYGTEGDTELAHVNTFEVGLLKSVGGSGTINEITGLRQFGPGGGSPPPPTQQVKQEASFPAELRPFVKDVLTQGQAEFERQQEEGFQAFPGPQISDFGPEQLAAQELGRRQFTGLAGTGLADPRTYYQPALSATALGTAEIGTGDIARRMDPFLQNVVDVAKREARRDEDIASQGRSAQAVGAGSFGGSRQAILEAEAERNLGQRLGDIQAQGLSQSFQNAQLAAEQQRAREMTGGRQFAALGDITGARARSDLSGLTGIGDVRQQREQQALDIARREFLDEQAFPQRTLQDYSSLIRGFPLDANQQRTTTETLATPSLAQTLIGGLGTAASIYGGFGGFSGSKEGGLVGLQGGGQPMMGPQMQQQPNEMDALEMLRQRGAAIRGLSKPIDTINRFGGGLGKRSGVAAPQPTGAVTRPDGLIMRNILKNNPELLEKLKGLGGGGQKAYTEFNPGTSGSQYASGGVVNKSIGSILRQYPGGAKSMDLAGDVRSAVRDKDSKGLLQMMLRKNPKLLKKLGVASGGGKKAYAEFNPGTAGSQYAGGGIVSLYMDGNPAIRQSATGEETETYVPYNPDITASARARAKKALEDYEEYQTSSDTKRDEIRGKREAVLAQQKNLPEYWQKRLESSDEARRQAQWGNLGKFFGRLSTDVSGGAQQGGLRGLLGATASAGAESPDEILATEAQFREERQGLEDKVFESNLDILKADLGISEKELAENTEDARYASEFALKYAQFEGDLAEIEADRATAIAAGRIKSADVNALSALVDKSISQKFTLGPDGKLVIVDGQAYSGAVQAQINRILDHGLQVLAHTGQIDKAYSVIQPYLSAIGGATKEAKESGTEIDMSDLTSLEALINPEGD